MSIVVRVFILILSVIGVLIGILLLVRPNRNHPTALSRFTDLRNGISCILLAFFLLAALIFLKR